MIGFERGQHGWSKTLPDFAGPGLGQTRPQQPLSQALPLLPLSIRRHVSSCQDCSRPDRSLGDSLQCVEQHSRRLLDHLERRRSGTSDLRFDHENTNNGNRSRT